MRRLAALTTLALAAGCGLQNHRVAVGTVVRSPEAGGAGATTAQVFFGDRPDGAGAPTGIAGADVTLSWTGGAASSVGLDPVGPAGWYQVTGTDIPYVPGTTYTVTVASRGELFTISSVAPARPAIQELVPGTPAFPPASAVTFEKQTVSRAGDDVAFYAVAPLSGAPTCTNAPVGAGSQDAARLVELLLAPAAWQVPSFELWRTDLAPTSAQRCFPAPAAGQYVVTLTALAEGGASSNLFTGSGLLVGASDAGVLLVQ